MSGASFSRYLGFTVLSGEDINAVGASIQSAVAPALARVAVITTPADIRYAVGENPTAVATGPRLLAGASIPVTVRPGVRIAVIGTGLVNVAWCA